MKRLWAMRPRPSYVAVLHDLTMVPLAWMAAYALRFNLGPIPAPVFSHALSMLPLLLAAQGAAYWYFGLYRGVWRFASLPDLARITKAVALGVFVSATLMFLFFRLDGVPRSVFPIYGLLLLVFLGGPRLAYRSFKDRRLGYSGASRVLIVGAGQAGEMLARDLIRTREMPYELVGFVDDDRRKFGKEVHGLRVLGNVSNLATVAKHLNVELVMIAVPSANSEQMRRIVEICESARIPFRTLPAVQDIVSGRAVLQTLREVSIEDLLGREPVSLNWDALHRSLDGKCVMVTGGGGSIGSELCRQIARLQPATLLIFENSEFNLYSVNMELQKRFPRLRVVPVLGDVTDGRAVQHVMGRYRPHMIFHAAAFKHVPLLEDQIRQSMRNNVLGTRILATAADQFHCDAFVLISTDKAVNPTNVMGATKRIAEIYCQNLNRQSRTRFITVRFGNVLGSAGSVVPLFRQQIARGGPVTVTHPEVTRYFMTIPEAGQLILQSAAMGRGGEIYVLDMGEPIKVAYLAEQMIRLAGKVPGEDVSLVFTGLRAGEKMNEELFHEQETPVGTDHEKIVLAKSRETDWDRLRQVMDRLEAAVKAYDESVLAEIVQTLVPEYHPHVPERTRPKVVPFNSTRGT